MTSSILKINLNFIIKLFFYMAEKLRQKFKYLENKKRFENKKHFSSFLKHFQLSKIVSELRAHL